MGKIKSDDIRGIYIEDLIVCDKCCTAEDRSGMKEKDIITNKMVDETDNMYFCDRCKKRL